MEKHTSDGGATQWREEGLVCVDTNCTELRGNNLTLCSGWREGKANRVCLLKVDLNKYKNKRGTSYSIREGIKAAWKC